MKVLFNNSLFLGQNDHAALKLTWWQVEKDSFIATRSGTPNISLYSIMTCWVHIQLASTEECDCGQKLNPINMRNSQRSLIWRTLLAPKCITFSLAQLMINALQSVNITRFDTLPLCQRWQQAIVMWIKYNPWFKSLYLRKKGLRTYIGHFSHPKVGLSDRHTSGMSICVQHLQMCKPLFT